MQNPEKFIVSLNTGGITNRLKNILSTLRVSEDLSRTPVVLWVENAKLQCRFNDLFENEFKLIETWPEYKALLRSVNWREYRKVSERFLKDRTPYLLFGTWRLATYPDDVPPEFSQMLPSRAGGDIDFEFERVPQFLRDRYVGLINQLKPVPYVQEQIDAFSENFDANTVSISARSWVEFQGRQKYFRIEEFYDLMDEMDDKTFFVSCDSREVLAKFEKRYGKRILSYPKRTEMGDRLSKVGMQDILVDLYLLGKNPRIITSFFSTFPETSWWFGGCQAEVEVVGVYDEIRSHVLKTDRQSTVRLMMRNLFYKQALIAKKAIKGA